MTDERPFTVRDRRSFTSEGELREVGSSDAAFEGPAVAPPPAAIPGDASATLESLFGDLAAAAAFHLGLVPVDGDEKPAGVDLAAARRAIAMLELLQDKTKGNRSQREDQLLERLLFELRMSWVARARGGAA